MKIETIKAREILDSRGNPTVEVDVILDSGIMGRAAVPSGASTGVHEALELRDGDKNRYGGKGVEKAVCHVNDVIAKALKGANPFEQSRIDSALIALDGTATKSKLGANAILGCLFGGCQSCGSTIGNAVISICRRCRYLCDACSYDEYHQWRSHSDAPIAFQEFMIRPVGAASFKEALRMGAEVFHALKSVLHAKGLSTAVGDEGGFAPALPGTEAAIETILEAISKAGYMPGRDVRIALDCASSEFYIDGVYDYTKFEGANGVKRTTQQQAEYLQDLILRYPIDSIEDGMSEEDWDGWRLLTDLIGDKCQLVGDDLFVTNVEYLTKGIRQHCANSILVKLNQIGTLTETLRAVQLAQRNGYTAVISHRSGETEDATIADIAVATNAGQIKTGSLSRSDRMAKYNQLLRIEEQLGDIAQYGYKQVN